MNDLISDSSLISYYQLCKLASEKVKVILGAIVMSYLRDTLHLMHSKSQKFSKWIKLMYSLKW